MTKTKSVLVMRPGRMGDFLGALPAMVAIRRKWVGHNVVLLTFLSSNAETAKSTRLYAGAGVPPWVEWYRESLFDDVITVNNWKSLREWRRMRRQLGGFKFIETLLLSYHGEKPMRRWQKWIWIRSLGVGGRVHSASMLADDARPEGVSLHAWTSLGVIPGVDNETALDGEIPAPRLGTADEMFAERLWREQKFEGKSVAAIFPSGTHAHKIWPAIRFAKVAAWLQAQGVRVILIGSARDREAVTAVYSEIAGDCCLDLAGETNLSQLAAVLHRCALFVGNDGGPAHLAATMGVRCVTLMSGVHRDGMWDPLGAKNIAVRFRTACYDCRSEFSCPAGTRACIDGIEVNEVIAACERQLAAYDRLHQR